MPADERHTAALAALGTLGPTEKVLTSDVVVGETWTFLRRRAGHATAVGFLDRVETLVKAGRLTLTGTDAHLNQDALMWLRKRGEREYSWVDAVSFATMRKRRLREALAFDGDFSAAGFVEVRG